MAPGVKGALTGLAIAVLPLWARASDTSSPYPFRAGTQWTYVDQAGSKTAILVEGHVSVQTPGGIATAAAIRRSDGSDRLVLRTTERWIECPALDVDRRNVVCDNALEFFHWPLTLNSQWSQGDLEFSVIGREAVRTKAGDYPAAWKISYAPVGERDPIGELWAVEGIGRVRLKEKGIDLSLEDYRPGKGDDLPAISPEVLRSVLSPPQTQPAPVKPTPSVLLHSLAPILSQSRWVTIGLPSLLFLLAIGLGWILASALRWGAKDDDLPIPLSSGDEVQLIAAIARSGDVREARTRMEDLVRSNPNYPDLHHQLAILHQAEGNLESAEKCWRRAITLNDRYAEARLNLGHLLSATQRTKEALEQFETVTRQRPTYADAFLALAKAQLELGDLKAGQNSAKAALAINPNLAEARELLENAEISPNSGA